MTDDHRFWAELHKDLSRIITFMRPRAPAEWREDAVQNTLIRIMGLLKAEKKKQEDISLAYARRVAFCTMANMWNPRLEALLDPKAVDAVRSDDLDPEAHALRLELGRLIEKQLVRLNRDRRLAMHLCVIQGHPVPEAATILGFSRKKTENLVHRGRQQLRQWLAEEVRGSSEKERPDIGIGTLLGWFGR